MALTPASVYFVVTIFLDIVVRSQMSSNSNSHSFFSSNDDVRYLVDNIPVSMHKDFSSSSVRCSRGNLRQQRGQNIRSIKLIGSQPFSEYQVDSLSDNLCLDSSPFQLVNGLPTVGDESIFSSKVYLKFHPPVLDFKERSLGVPHHEKVTIINTSRNKTVHMSSISGNTVQFHSSFFHDKVIPPLGNTTFNVVFLGRGEGDIESYLFIHTSEGSFKYHVKGESVSSPYRLRPLSGIKLPLNASYSPLILMHNPHNTPLQLVEVYSSGGDFHLELPSGELEGPKHLWQIPAFLTKPVIRLRFHASSQKNHTAYIRLKVDKSGEVLVVPVEVEVGAVSGLYSPDDLIDFGIGGTEDAPKQIKLFLQNSWKKPIRVQNIISTPVSRALKIDFQPIKVPPDVKRPVQVAVLTFDWKAAYESGLSSGRVIIKSNHSGQKLVMGYKAIVLAGGFVFNHTETSFHSDQSDVQPRSVTLMNNYKVPVAVTNVTLMPSSMPYFEVHGFTPFIIMPGEKRSLLRLSVKNGSLPANIKLESSIEVSSNASTISIPLLCYNGKLTKVVSSDANETQLHLGTVGSGGMEIIHFSIVNDNPVPVKVFDWGVNVTGATVRIVSAQKGNLSSAILTVMTAHFFNTSLEESVLEPGHYFLLQASIPTGSEPGMKNCEVWVSTQYEVIVIPVYMRVEHGSLKVITNPVIFQDCFPSAICSAEVRVESHFTVGMAVTGVSSVPHQSRLGFVPVSPPLIPPGGSTLLGHITWDMSGLETYLSPNISVSGGHRWIDTLELPAHTREWDLSLLTARYERYLNISAQLVELSLRLDTTEVRNLGFRAKIRPAWPSLSSIPSRTIHFPLTQVGNVSYEHLQITNPASKQPVIVQLVFDPSYPLASGLVRELPSSLRPPFNSCCESTHKETENVFHLSRDSDLTLPPGVEPHEKSLAFLLMPLSNVSIKIGFKPDVADVRSSILMIRNNLTILEIVRLVGTGAYAQFRFGNRKPGSSLPLMFELSEKHLKDCDKDPNLRLYIPNLTVKRSFTAKNIGALPLNILGFTINGHSCQGYGFRVLDCHPFHLQANSSKKIDIAFTPDFTLSRVTRLLSILTSDTTANYTLIATLPPYLLSTCSAVLSRPAWEPLVYYCAVSFMVFLVICVLAAAYFESNRILRNAIIALTKDSCVQPVLDLRLVGSEVSASFSGTSRLESPFKFSWAMPHSSPEMLNDKVKGPDECSSLTPYNNKQGVVTNGVYNQNKKKNDRSLCKAVNESSDNIDRSWEHNNNNNNRSSGSSQINKPGKTSATGMCITTEPYTPLTNIKAREMSTTGKASDLTAKPKGEVVSKGMEPSAKKAKKKISNSGNEDSKKRISEEFISKNNEDNDSSSHSESSSNDDGDAEVESMFFRSVRHHLQNKANRNKQMKPLDNSPCRVAKPRKYIEKGSSSSVENECEVEDDDFLDQGIIVKNNRRSSSLKSTKRGVNNKPKNELPPSRPKVPNGERKPLLRKEKALVPKKRPEKTSTLLKSSSASTTIVVSERSSPLPPPPSVWTASFSDVVARSDSSYSSVVAPRNSKAPTAQKPVASPISGSQVARSETGIISPAKEKDMVLTYAEVLLGKNVPSTSTASTNEGNDIAPESKPAKKCNRRRSKKRGRKKESVTHVAGNNKEFATDWKPDSQETIESSSSAQPPSQTPIPIQIAGPVGTKRPVNSIWSNWPQFTDAVQHSPSPTPSSANSLFTDCSQQIGSAAFEGNWADHNLIKILHDQQNHQQNPSPVDTQFDVRPNFNADVTWPVVTSVWEPLYTPSSAVESPPPVWGSDVWGPPTPPTPPPENNPLMCPHSMEYDPFRSLSNIWSQHSPNIWKSPPSD